MKEAILKLLQRRSSTIQDSRNNRGFEGPVESLNSELLDAARQEEIQILQNYIHQYQPPDDRLMAQNIGLSRELAEVTRERDDLGQAWEKVTQQCEEMGRHAKTHDTKLQEARCQRDRYEATCVSQREEAERWKSCALDRLAIIDGLNAQIEELKKTTPVAVTLSIDGCEAINNTITMLRNQVDAFESNSKFWYEDSCSKYERIRELELQVQVMMGEK